MVYLFLFIGFFFIGLTAWGGADALPAFLQSLLVTRWGWMSSAQFADLMALCFVCPGGLGINAAAWGGYAAVSGTMGFWAAVGGSVVGLTGISLPSICALAAINRFRKNTWVLLVKDSVLSFLRILLPGILAAGALMLMNEKNFGNIETTPWQFGVSIFLFVSTLVGTLVYRFSALFMVFLCGIAGWLLL